MRRCYKTYINEGPKRPKMREEISEALLKKYLDRTCSSEEASIVEDWYRSIADE